MNGVVSGRFCSHGGRSWTDLYTNVTLLAEINLLFHSRAIIHAGEYVLPPRLAPSFIHEATHHWCFHTSVGTALALLQLRAHRRAVADVLEIRRFTRRQIADDLGRVDAAEECLRPLAEGLALFAEFDVTPRMLSTSKVSLPMWWTHHFFSQHRSNTVAEGLFYLLEAMRSSPEMERRRRGVLADDCTGVGGGYLPGYLTVKHAWLMAIQSDSRFLDRDLFMMFFKEMIFGDLELVGILLEPKISYEAAVPRIVQCIEGRLASLWSINLEQELTQYIAGIDLGTGMHATIATDSAVAARGNELIRAHMKEIALIEPKRKGSGWKYLCAVDGLSMGRRDLMRLGSMWAQASITPHGDLLLEADGEPLLSMRPESGIALEPNSDVMLDVEASLAFDDVVATVWQGHKLLAQVLITLPGGKPRNNKNNPYYFHSREEQHAHYEKSRKTVASIFDPKVRETLRIDVREEFVDFLSEIALGQTPFDSRAQRWASMASEGVLALLDGNNDELKLLSKIGLISSLSSGAKITLKMLENLGIQEVDVARLAQTGLDIGVPLVILQDDVLIAVT